MAQRFYSVLFLCTGNSARSIMAECIVNRRGKGRFKGFSAGSHPKGEVHPFALDLLRKEGYETAHLRSKDWAEFAAPEAPAIDLVFTVCDNAANEVCPIWPGRPVTAHWALPDPAAVEGTEARRRSAFADCLRVLTWRIDILVNLPVDEFDKPTLREKLDRIGGTLPGTM